MVYNITYTINKTIKGYYGMKVDIPANGVVDLRALTGAVDGQVVSVEHYKDHSANNNLILLATTDAIGAANSDDGVFVHFNSSSPAYIRAVELVAGENLFLFNDNDIDMSARVAWS